jgi:serine/threonine protein phosphatase PrpC
MEIKVACLCNTGGRPINDDTVMHWTTADGEYVYVGDGLGGYAGGQQASQAAGRALQKISGEGPLLDKESMYNAWSAAEQAVKQTQIERQGVMKTTLVFLAMEKEMARWMHVGDSRLYRFQNGKLVKQTMDHSVSQMAVLMGDITPQQIRFHEDRNRVLRALGGDNAKADISPETELVAGRDAFLMCTDGFWEYVYEPEMEELLLTAETPQQWLEEMEKILLSRVPSDNDNYTAAAVFCK